jgi:hypothetical protein
VPSIADMTGLSNKHEGESAMTTGKITKRGFCP